MMIKHTTPDSKAKRKTPRLERLSTLITPVPCFSCFRLPSAGPQVTTYDKPKATGQKTRRRTSSSGTAVPSASPGVGDEPLPPGMIVSDALFKRGLGGARAVYPEKR